VFLGCRTAPDIFNYLASDSRGYLHNYFIHRYIHIHQPCTGASRFGLLVRRNWGILLERSFLTKVRGCCVSGVSHCARYFNYLASDSRGYLHNYFIHRYVYISRVLAPHAFPAICSPPYMLSIRTVVLLMSGSTRMVAAFPL